LTDSLRKLAVFRRALPTNAVERNNVNNTGASKMSVFVTSLPGFTQHLIEAKYSVSELLGQNKIYKFVMII
jgi:hypothetical protein